LSDRLHESLPLINAAGQHMCQVAAHDVIERKGKDGATHVVQNIVRIQRDRLRIQTRQWSMGKAVLEVYGDNHTIRDERHPLDLMIEEERLAATIELVEKVKALLDQAV
jgi:hypothetical protein